MLGRKRIRIAGAFPIEAFVLSRFLIKRRLKAVSRSERVSGMARASLLPLGASAPKRQDAGEFLRNSRGDRGRDTRLAAGLQEPRARSTTICDLR